MGYSDDLIWNRGPPQCGIFCIKSTPANRNHRNKRTYYNNLWKIQQQKQSKEKHVNLCDRMSKLLTVLGPRLIIWDMQ